AKNTAPTKTLTSEKPDSSKTASNPPKKADSSPEKPVVAAKNTASTKTLTPEKPDSSKTASNPPEKKEGGGVKSAVSTQNVIIDRTDISSGDRADRQLKPVDTIAPLKKSQEVPALIASLSPLAEPATSPVQAEKQSAKTQVSRDLKSSRFTGQLLTLDFVDLPLVDFFRVMSEEGGINIVLDPKVKGNISIKVEKLPWDQIFDTVLVNHSLDKQIEGNLIRIAHKSTLQEEAKQRESLKKAELLAADLETRIKRLNYAKAEDLIESLDDLKTVRGTVVQNVRTNSLVLTDIPDSLDKMIDLITSLDIPQPQVEIEARIVSAARDFAREIGVQFGFVQGNLERVTVGGPNTFGTIGGTRPSATPSTTYVAGNELTGRGASGSSASESGAVSAGETGNYNVNLPASKAFGGLGISIGNIFDTFLLDAALTAGESKGLAKLISQPKVTAQNNSPAVIRQGTRFPVQVVANNTISVQFYDAALILTVLPQITYEGNIVLDLKVENNTADWSRSAVGDPPSIKISESDTRVLVSDGGTTVIGGILVDEESNTGDKVPGLGSLPLIGNLFRRTAVSRNSTEILFFITPRIVK
ncbi:MAG: type IV pilus secretin PilQ, partial [Acidobacteriota bacterium]